ncbi:DUF1376 domain-containing protein [Falsirhodobacter sp. 1013]|uniref:DUF1376 domain-containing protein n=1 Tax=Falsirhodobacter sp. 1013 TaxID=3417566 RepID=UPI003EB82A8E
MTRHIPYFSFYPADFMNGVRGLTPQEVGVYTMILCRIYEENGPIEANTMRLATYCGMREKTFAVVMQKLVDLGKFSLIEGMVINRRALEEIQKRSDGLKNNSKAGKASAEKRQQKQAKQSTPVQQPFNHTDTDTDTEKLGDTDVSPCSVDRGPTFDQFWSSWPLQKQGKENARKAFAKLSASQKTAATEQCAAWCGSWRMAHPQASDIHPATYLNNKRWEDEAPTQPPFKVIHGRANERSQFDTAHRGYTRRLRAGEIHRGPDPSDPFAG